MGAKNWEDNTCNSTGEEKISIMAPKLWFPEGLYTLEGEGKKQLRRK